jgi:hypothetical protein
LPTALKQPIEVRLNVHPTKSESALIVTSAPSQDALDRVYEEFCSHIGLKVTPETSTQQRGTNASKQQSTGAEAETFNPAQIRQQLFSPDTEDQPE